MNKLRLDSQDNFIESRDPSEFFMCMVLTAVYLGLAKYCWSPLYNLHSLKLLLNVEGFFIIIALLAFIVGVRPMLNPSSLQLSQKGIKYKGPYWPNRKSVVWDQIEQLYVSPELVIVLYRPDLKSKRLWPMLIATLYLSDRNSIQDAITKYSPVPPIIMSNPALLSRMMVLFFFFVVVIWLIELLMK